MFVMVSGDYPCESNRNMAVPVYSAISETTQRWWFPVDRDHTFSWARTSTMFAFTATQAESPEYQLPKRFREQVHALARRAGWRAGGGRAITRRDCDTAVNFLEVALGSGVPEPSAISPSPLGAVAFTWRLGKNLVYAEVCQKHQDRVYFQWGGATTGDKEGFSPRRDFLLRLLSLVDQSTT